MSYRLYLINQFNTWLPPTRFYRMRARLFKWANLNIHNSARLVSSVKIWTSGSVVIGKDTFVGHECIVTSGNAPIHIGNDVDIGPRVVIVAGTHEIDPTGPRSAGEGYAKAITIEDGVWIGAGSIIIGGCKIGKKSVIGAGSVVVCDIPAGTIAVGNPCKPIKQLDSSGTHSAFPLTTTDNPESK